jgi:hypothetical protein
LIASEASGRACGGVVDRKKKAVVGEWQTGGASANFPMALDEANHRLFTVCRQPAVLLVLNTDSGAVVARIPTVGHLDDVFYDPTRKRIYASGGEGTIAVYQQRDPDHYQEVARIPTVKGAHEPLCSGTWASVPGNESKAPKTQPSGCMQCLNDLTKTD